MYLGDMADKISWLVSFANLSYKTKRAKETMRTLIAKYPDGYEGWAKEKGEEPVQRVYSPTSYSLLRTHEVSKSQ